MGARPGDGKGVARNLSHARGEEDPLRGSKGVMPLPHRPALAGWPGFSERFPGWGGGALTISDAGPASGLALFSPGLREGG
ncbi:MAG: hypothetical protein ACTSXC_07585 [Candidatus Freyarchaeota archaeon]